MFDYSVPQKTFEVHGVKIGGEPGLVPTVMVGSMFYNGHLVVENASEGLFDAVEAEAELRDAEEMSDTTGLPTVIDLVAENTFAASKYLDFMVDTTDMPIFLDVLSDQEQVGSLHYAHEQGMMDRILLNSVNPHTGDKVYEALKETGCKHAVLLLHSMRHMLSSNKDAVLEEMVPKAEAAGVESILVDTVVIDIPTLGLATKAIHRIKDKYGYPCGCGAHNALASWRRLREKYTPRAVTMATAITSALPIAAGGDFVFYGPVKNAKAMYPAIALIDAAYSQHHLEKRVRVDRSHPRYRIG